MSVPVNNIVDYTNDISLCFDDGFTGKSDNPYTGKWVLNATDTYGDRAFWYKLGPNGGAEYYMFYDPTWRFWVIDKILGRLASDDWHYYCLKWDEFEPFNCDIWYSATAYDGYYDTLIMTQHCTLCNARETYVYAESTLSSFSGQTLMSDHVNFAPYIYSTFYREKLVLFEEGSNITDITSNPCDYVTWLQPSTFYDGNVVMIEYSDFIASLCSVEQWTLELESYANVIGVIVVNNADLYHVYSLSGDDTLIDPTIPTRMISQLAGLAMKDIVTEDNQIEDNVIITFGCFDDDIYYPSIICLVDTSIMGKHVFLDGEYQRQVGIDINDHPVWLKKSFEGLWKNIFMFLDVDQSVTGDASWRWVIGTDYNDKDSIVAECDLNGDHIDHPALCGRHWYINNTLQDNISTTNTTCALGDNYLCVESSPGSLFDIYFTGQYRQIHDGVPLWLFEDTFHDIYITIGQITFPPVFVEAIYAFAFIMNQSDVWAFCPIGNELPTNQQRLSPYECNKDWYVMDYDWNTKKYDWVIDFAFDIDECYHPNITVTEPEIVYPSALCLSDPTNKHSHYQSHYGIYLLDETTTYDDRYVYYNQRLKGNHDEWYMLWYDAKDSWVINEMVSYIPGIDAVRDTEGICRADVFTPDLCTECWEFYYLNGLTTEMNCDVTVTPINSVNERDCMKLPVNNMNSDEYTTDLMLGFDDGKMSIDDNPYTGQWRLETDDTYGDRSFWYKIGPNAGNRRLLQTAETTGRQYYMFYDPTWRFWVIDEILGRLTNNDWHLYCVHWDEFEPFNCGTWYTDNGTVTMVPNYKMPTTELTEEPTHSPSESIHIMYFPSVSPTPLHLEDIPEDIPDEGLEDGKSKSSWWVWLIGALVILFLCLMGCTICYCYMMRKTKNKFKNDVGHTIVAMNSVSDETVDLDLIQMGTDTKGKGEIVPLAIVDDDDSSNGSIPDGIDGMDTVTSPISPDGIEINDDIDKPLNGQQDGGEDDQFIREYKQVSCKQTKGYLLGKSMSESDGYQVNLGDAQQDWAVFDK